TNESLAILENPVYKEIAQAEQDKFYSNAMNPEVQAAFAATVPTNPIQPPGVPPSMDSVNRIRDKYGVADEDLYYKAKTAPQSYDLPVDGTLVYQEENNSSQGPKTDQNKTEDEDEFST